MINVKSYKQFILITEDNNYKTILSEEDINEILNGYIECALWTEEERLQQETNHEEENDDGDDDDDEIEKFIKLQNNFNNKDFNVFVSDDIDVDSKIDAYLDIKKFINTAGKVAVDEAISENGLFKLGMDIWFTRNGHGSGFFDHSYENEDVLIRAGNKLGPKDLYIGDDGKLYFS